MEVLVAFSLLSILLVVIIQTQADTTYFLGKTGKLALVQKEVINELLKIERNLGGQQISTSNGVFPDDHQLAGDRWYKEVVLEDFMDLIKITKITFRITWKTENNENERSFESSILGEVR